MKRRLLFILLLLTLVVGGTAAQQVPVGEVVTVQGIVEVVSPNAFRLINATPFDVGASDIVVFTNSIEGFGIDINNGMRVEVRGEMINYDLGTLEATLPYDLATLALVDFGPDDYAIVASAVTDITDVAAIDDPAVLEIDPARYFGDVVTTEGFADILSRNVFRVLDTTPFSLSPANILVIPDTSAGFAIDVDHGIQVQVTGVLRAFDIAAIEADTGIDLDEDTLSGFDASDFAIIASSVVEIADQIFYDDPVIGNLETDPTLFVEDMVQVEGVADIVSTRAFEITDTLPFDLTPSRIVVLPDTATGFLIDINNGLPVAVTGTLVEFNLLQLEARLGYDLNNAALAEYGDGDYAVIARSVVAR